MAGSTKGPQVRGVWLGAREHLPRRGRRTGLRQAVERLHRAGDGLIRVDLLVGQVAVSQHGPIGVVDGPVQSLGLAVLLRRVGRRGLVEDALLLDRAPAKDALLLDRAPALTGVWHAPLATPERAACLSCLARARLPRYHECVCRLLPRTCEHEMTHLPTLHPMGLVRPGGAF